MRQLKLEGKNIGGTAISGLYAIFYDGEYFRIKNIPDTMRLVKFLTILELISAVQSKP